MKTVFISNFFSPHQRALCHELYKINGEDFCFIETEEMPPERKALGWREAPKPPYVLQSFLSRENLRKCMQLIEEADVLIAGSAPEFMLRRRIYSGGLTFRYSERPLKNGGEWHKYLFRLVRWNFRNPRRGRVYLLCAGAHTSGDYARFSLFKGRAYRFGYFPGCAVQNEGALLREKEPCRVLWAGRLIDCKRAGDALEAAAILLSRGVDFRLDIVGDGPQLASLRADAEEKGLGSAVVFHGALESEQVFRLMARSAVFLFTSDSRDGWGAVVNEAMSFRCAVVAAEGSGCVPSLIRSGENGLTYPVGSAAALADAAESLLANPKKREKMAQLAGKTIDEEWNAAEAARRLMLLSRRILAGETAPNPFPNGLCGLENGERRRKNGA